MFGVALDIKVSDFKRLIENPKPPIVGLISQLIWLPLFTMVMVFALRLPPSMTLGMILICLLYTSPSPRDATLSRMPSSA